MNTTTAPNDVATIDLMHLGRANVIASYLLLGDEPALVDPGPASTLAALEAGLAEQGLALGDLRAILLTHIHLDHAAATGSILARNPRVRVYVHERGAQHLIDPSRLLSSATQLYGNRMGELWGEMLPVPSAAVTTLSGAADELRLGGRRVRAHNAPGHAKHHLIWHDERGGGVFVGDNCGVRVPGVPFARPATPPPDIDLEAWMGTLTLIGSLQPTSLLLTHFGAFNDVAFHLADYRERLTHWGELVRAGLGSGQSEPQQVAALQAVAAGEIAGLSEEQRAALAQQGGSIEVNWHGLARYWQKRGLDA